jgi:hypothetical protein
VRRTLAAVTVAVVSGTAYASPNPFLLNGAVDFGGGTVAGGLGASLTWDGTADWGAFGGQWFGPAFTNTGFQFEGANGIIQPNILDGAELNPDGFRGAVFFAGTGVPSEDIDLDGDGITDVERAVRLMHLGPGLTNIRIADDAPAGGQNGKAYIQIDSVPQFVGFGVPNENLYALVLTDLPQTGGKILWLTQIPSPAGSGLICLAGLAAARRRR